MQIGRFRTVTPVWIHWWIWNDTQRLMLYRRGALLFFGVIHQISRSHGRKIDDLNPIWVRLLGRSQLSNPSDLPCWNYCHFCQGPISLLMYVLYQYDITNRVWCQNNVVSFLQNHQKRHPIARLWGQGMGCHLWVQPLINFCPSHSSTVYILCYSGLRYTVTQLYINLSVILLS